ncbi:MAG: hypothetical protein IKW62_02400 [Clostridia bacterium]|nr:hypothetical protein [Clostridia bacterium]
MKITRFVNGEKLNKPIDGNIFIKKEIISETIDKVNRRLNINHLAKDVIRVETNE